MPSGAAGIGSSFHSLIHEKRCNRLPVVSRMGRGHRGRLQPVERGFQPQVVVEGRCRADEAQDLVGSARISATGGCPRRGLHDLRGCPKSKRRRPISWRCHARRCLHADGDIPLRKSIGAGRRDFASEKNGTAIKAWLSRGAMSPGSARNRSSCSRCCKACPGGLDMAKATHAPAFSGHHGSHPRGVGHIPGRKSPRSCAGRPRHRGRLPRT